MITWLSLQQVHTIHDDNNEWSFRKVTTLFSPAWRETLEFVLPDIIENYLT